MIEESAENITQYSFFALGLTCRGFDSTVVAGIFFYDKPKIKQKFS